KPNKAIRLGLPEVQLYNLSTDIGEKVNLYEENPGKAKELYDLLMKCVDDGRSTPGEKQTNDPSLKGSWPQYEKLLNLDIAK
ncbi:MAG: arylsulfatase, partial [Bacteroidales bacterium]|nr:arylsulfatase [Bacteroidales bacterium]